MIVLLLASVLLGTLFYSQKDTAVAERQLEEVKLQVLERERFFLRLNQILSSGVQLKQSEQGLLLFYDNGVDPNPQFCGPVLSRLYWQEGKIFLATWPKGKEEGRLEILWNKADAFGIIFFDETNNQWGKELPKSSVKMMKISIDQVEFPFFL